jgi:hypothetical protein
VAFVVAVVAREATGAAAAGTASGPARRRPATQAVSSRRVVDGIQVTS